MKPYIILMFKLFFFLCILSELNLSFSKTIQVRYSDKKVKIDGVFNTDEWQDADQTEITYEISPGENTQAPVKTIVFIKYDHENIYFGFKAFDKNPENIRARYSDRDQIFGDDLVGLMLDTFCSGQRAYEFVCNPFGVQQDFMFTQSSGEDLSWDTIWESVGAITDYGYFVEISIPFNSITFPSGNDHVWGIALYRIYPRDYRYRLYSFPEDRNFACMICQFDKLEGINDIQPGRNLEIAPSLVVQNLSSKNEFNAAMSDSNTVSTTGLNLRWGPTSNIIINAAFNPDFSQIEADAAQLSVNRRYALYFQEKRPFFLEESDKFKTNEDVLYSRTIADPSFGLKATGKIGRTHFGTFYAEDSITNFIEPSHSSSTLKTIEKDSKNTVVRLKQDILSNSFIGLIHTHRKAGSYENTVTGVDGRIYFSKNDFINFQFLTSDRNNPVNEDSQSYEKESFSGSDIYLGYSHRSRNWQWAGYYFNRDKDFRADMGFINQVGVEIKGGYISYKYYFDAVSWISDMSNQLEFNTIEDFSGQLIEQELEYVLETQLSAQSFLNIELEDRKELYNNILYEGLKEYIIEAGSKPAKFLTAELTYIHGDYIDYANNRPAKGNTTEAEVELKLGHFIKFDLSYVMENLDVNNTNLYSAKITQGTFIYNFNSRMFMRAIIQHVNLDRNPENYDFQISAKDKEFLGQLLFSYKINPRTLFYLGYSTGSYGDEFFKLQTFNKTIFLKLTYAFSL